MNSSAPQPPGGSPPPPEPTERLLGARLRTTRPQFEARFDALARELSHPAPAPAWLARLAAAFHRRSGWTAAGLGGAVLAGAAALAVVVLRPSPRPPSGPTTAALTPADATDEFSDLFTLDADLRGALPLADPETRDAVLLLPLDPGKQS